ncbi:MAG: AIR synthase-related protein, partial [Acidimicrobiia bacterium]|nr:AIR synthase-related protein [Acidimicrobiia bacterium]
GHRLIGLRSSGLHTNGYSLARKVFSGRDLEEILPLGDGEYEPVSGRDSDDRSGSGSGERTLGQALVAPHRSYLEPLAAVLETDLVAGLAHITGGGLIDNIPRVLPDGCGAVIDTKAWKWPPLFDRIVRLGGLNRVEAHQILNLGIGMVVVVAPDDAAEVQRLIPEPTMVIGRVVAGRDVSLS